MIHFESDYCEGAHPHILKRLMDTNLMQTSGYGEDEICESARKKINKAIGKKCDVHFLVGGTQANKTVISAILRPHHGVISSDCGHINVHETGAIENSGHKVLTLPSVDGLINASQISEMIELQRNDGSFEHLVKPGMVYLSWPTEVGTLYTKRQLKDIYRVCKHYDIPLFIDGARLGYGLASPANDCSLKDIASLCDVFYIGGTKVGALFGEAVVFTNTKYNTDFRYHIKQQGGMLAKGRLLGIQFDELFENNLYFDISKKAIDQALRLRKCLNDKNYSFSVDSPTNQLFVYMTPTKLAELSKKYRFSTIKKIDDQRVEVRICTSWATLDENLEQLIKDL